MNCLNRRIEILSQAGSDYEGLRQKPELRAQLKNVLAKEKKVLEILQLDDGSENSSLHILVSEFYNYKHTVGSEGYVQQINELYKSKISAQEIELFLEDMIFFLNQFHQQLGKIKYRMRREENALNADFQKTGTSTDPLDEYIWCWEGELKENLKLLEIMQKLYKRNENIFTQQKNFMQVFNNIISDPDTVSSGVTFATASVVSGISSVLKGYVITNVLAIPVITVGLFLGYACITDEWDKLKKQKILLEDVKRVRHMKKTFFKWLLGT
jgi:hypothetical protein